MNDTVILTAAFLSASLHMTRLRAHKRGLQRYHHNKEDMMDVMICGKLHAAIRYK